MNVPVIVINVLVIDVIDVISSLHNKYVNQVAALAPYLYLSKIS